MRFEQLLSRADDEVLQDLIGPPVVRLLTMLDPKLARPTRLRELVTSFRPPEELLRNPDTRAALLDLLPPDDATDLAAQLDLNPTTPFDSLRNARFSRNSAAERILFRALSVVAVETPKDDHVPVRAATSARYGLFAHQRHACRKSRHLLDEAPNRVVLHMPTGSGKTRTAMHLIASELRQREPSLAIWLAYSEELCEQAAGEFETAWAYLGDREITTYRLWGKRSIGIDDVQDGFLVAGLAKMFQMAKRDADFLVRLADRASLVVIDEAHQAIAETYRFVLEVLCERHAGSRLLGLTATPGRTWNDPDKDKELADFFGRRKVALHVPGYDSPIDYLIAEGYLARPDFQALHYTGAGSLSAEDLSRLGAALDIPEDILSKLADDEQRNLLIINRIERLASQHARTLVFAATVNHARVLATVLRVRGIDADAVTAATPPGERSRIITRFKGAGEEPRVLCNYGVLTTGFDAPRTSAALIARPTKSLVLYSQMVGRATRGVLAGGNKASTIVTVVDKNLPGFGTMQEAFMNWEDVW